MNTKIKFFVGFVFLLVLGLIFLFWFFGKNDSSDTNQANNNQNTTTKTFPIIHGEKPSDKTSTFEIKTQGGSITVNNLYNLPGAQPLSYDGVNFKNSQYYHMEYYPKQQGFIIAITDKDIQKAREFAEIDFLSTLNINKEQACKLNVSLTVTPTASEKASGGNYGLSFCPNGKAFPK